MQALLPDVIVRRFGAQGRAAGWSLLLLITAYATCCALSIGTVYQTGNYVDAGLGQWDVPKVAVLIIIAWPFQFLALGAAIRLLRHSETMRTRHHVLRVAGIAAIGALLGMACILVADMILLQRWPLARLQVGLDSVEILYAATCLLPVATYVLQQIAHFFPSAPPQFAAIWSGSLGSSASTLLLSAVLLAIGWMIGPLGDVYGPLIAVPSVMLMHIGAFVLVLSIHQALFRRDDVVSERNAVRYALVSLLIFVIIVVRLNERSLFRPTEMSDTWKAILAGLAIVALIRILMTLRILLRRWSLTLVSMAIVGLVYGFGAGIESAETGRVDELKRIAEHSMTREHGKELADNVFKQGVRPNLHMDGGRSPLGEVCRTRSAIAGVRHYMAAELLRRGADPNLYDHYSTPLSSAIYSGDTVLVKLLLENGADANQPTGDKVLRTEWQKGADPDFGHEKPLVQAAYHDRNGEIVTSLLQAGAKLDPDSYGRTPLHNAHSPKVAEILMNAGSNIEAKDRRGKTPLDQAIDTNNEALAEFLLSKGAIRHQVEENW